MPRSDHQLKAELALWIIQLNDENPHTREQVHLEFLKWQQDHPEAQELLADMVSFSENMQHLSSTHHLSSKTAQQSLQTIEIQQKKTLERFKFTTLGLILIIGGLFSYDQLISQPTYQTLIGEKQSYTLPDGSKIILGADSKIRLHYNAQIRHIELVDGEIYVDVAQDQKRPFVIKTKYANFKALGTRFIVDQYYDKSRITMLHSTVEISALNLSQQKYASMGEQFLIQSTGDWNKKRSIANYLSKHGNSNSSSPTNSH